MKRVFGSSEKKGEGRGSDQEPECTPEQVYSLSHPAEDDEEDENVHELAREGSEFTIPPEYRQAYAKLKAVTEEQYESMTTNIFSQHSSVDAGAAKTTQ